MHNLPDTLNTHPFFKHIRSDMNETVIKYKDLIDNYSNLDKQKQNSIFFELLDLGFHWPNPLRQEGFWCEQDQKDYLLKEFPYPQENQMNQDDIAEFLSKLSQVEKKAKTFTYMGFSKCRICSQTNGTKTYYTDLFAWPERFKHYIKDHGVKPSAAFVLHIRGLIK